MTKRLVWVTGRTSKFSAVYPPLVYLTRALCCSPRPHQKTQIPVVPWFPRALMAQEGGHGTSQWPPTVGR